MAYYGNRTPASGSSIGGISAVNPQAKTNFKGYVDQAYDASKARLDPIFQQQQQGFDQSLVNRGIPVGSEAYSNASRDLRQSHNDAYTQAANAAIGVGLGAQAQDFGQDATRSQLANALLQSKWSSDLGYAGLDEGARQFDVGLGENARQFDAGQDYNYWDRGNFWDYQYDRADMSDLQWLTGVDKQSYDDQLQSNRWSDNLGNSYLSPYDPAGLNINPLVSNQYANMGIYGQNQGNNQAWWDNFMASIQGIGEGTGWY